MNTPEPNQALRDATSRNFERNEKDAVTAFSLIQRSATASFLRFGVGVVLGLIIIGVGVTGPA
jgi:hypothetical protein